MTDRSQQAGLRDTAWTGKAVGGGWAWGGSVLEQIQARFQQEQRAPEADFKDRVLEHVS